MNYKVFVAAAKGLEYLLEAEVKSLGLDVSQVSPQGVFGEASLKDLYRICLWTRLANRVNLLLFSDYANDEKSIYNLCKNFAWQTIFPVNKTFAIEFHGSSSKIRHSVFGAQVVKDAIVDYFRELTGSRPSINKENPDILLHAHLHRDKLTLSLDLAGYSLHQRGYRKRAGEAPLKETLAAAMLIRASWPELAKQGYSLLDPCCGSGTLVIEAAMMAANMAPGLIRQDQAFEHWVDHQPELWEELRAEAGQQCKPISNKLQGRDADSYLIDLANINAAIADVRSLVDFSCKKLEDNRPLKSPGLLITNPPYGERLEESSELLSLYKLLGSTAHKYFQGWNLAFLTSNSMLAKAVGLKSSKQYQLYNGPIECKLYLFSLDSSNRLKESRPEAFSEGAQMIANRLKKNFQHLEKWAKRHELTCYRVYDADLPEYAYAIDIYNDYAVLQEYAAPASIPTEVQEKRSLELIQVVPYALGIDADKLVIKQRKRQKGLAQYEKLNQKKQSLKVREGLAFYKVNLYDYLDTGLFLDHRILRLRFAKLQEGTKFLNCFCYTGTASVQAALAGAHTTNIDLSNTYLAWAKENFHLNSLDIARHTFIQDDCLSWLKYSRSKFDVIFLDPPSFSNSKRMQQTLDVQRDHVTLIKAAMRLLLPKGILYFSTNLRQFKLASELESEYSIKNLSAETIDQDFKRNKRIHHCYEIKLEDHIA